MPPSNARPCKAAAPSPTNAKHDSTRSAGCTATTRSGATPGSGTGLRSTTRTTTEPRQLRWRQPHKPRVQDQGSRPPSRNHRSWTRACHSTARPLGHHSACPTPTGTNLRCRTRRSTSARSRGDGSYDTRHSDSSDNRRHHFRPRTQGTRPGPHRTDHRHPGPLPTHRHPHHIPRQPVTMPNQPSRTADHDNESAGWSA